MAKALVAGAGGFIGGHLAGALLDRGWSVRAVDKKPLEQWFQVHPSAENATADLSLLDEADRSCRGVDWVFNLAADMGGMGFIEANKALCMLSSLINTHLLLGAKKHDVKRFFFASSACVYASWHQEVSDVTALKEADAYPADPEDGYGWEKLFAERMCRHFREDFGLDTRVARYHNIYGPYGSFDGGREKAPAAACRKVAQFKHGDLAVVDIWGDGQQTRSFTYIDDCVEGTLRLMESDYCEPINIGSSELVSVQGLYDRVAHIADVRPDYVYNLEAPLGVRGRSSDNAEILRVLGWQPSISLATGLQATYEWIDGQLYGA